MNENDWKKTYTINFLDDKERDVFYKNLQELLNVYLSAYVKSDVIDCTPNFDQNDALVSFTVYYQIINDEEGVWNGTFILSPVALFRIATRGIGE